MSGAAIDLWWFPLLPPGEACFERAAALLGPDERKRLRRFEWPDAAGLFALRRAVRRVILAEYLGCGPGEIAFAEPEGAKPRIVRPATDFAFNASDTAGLGVVAVANGVEVGVDVEADRAVDVAGFERRILTPAEQALLRQRPGARLRKRLILQAWTAKEAVLKGIGTGLDLAAMRQIGLAQTPGSGEWQAVSPERPDGPGRGWQVLFYELTGPGGGPAVAAVACRSPLPVEVRPAAALIARHGLG